MMAVATNSESVEIPTLAEFISTQTTDAGFCSAFVLVERPNICFNVDCDGVVRVFSADGTSQRV